MDARYLTGQPLPSSAFRRRAADLTQPGDVVLTGSTGIISTSIQILSRSRVSHAILATAHGEAIEANDYINRTDDQGGGPYCLTMTEVLTNPNVEFIALRRPHDIDADTLQSWARTKIAGRTRFATAGLVMMGIASAAHRLKPWRRRDHPATLRRTEAIADGPRTLTCSEFVTRGLLAAGTEIQVENPQFADEYALLPPASAEPVTHLPRRHSNGFERLSAWARRSPVHRDPPGTRSIREDDIPDLIEYLATNFARFRATNARRRTDPPDGDRADFVTPRDLLLTESLTDVAAFHKTGDDAWHECDLGAVRHDLRARLNS